jgi:hypothetical protein
VTVELFRKIVREELDKLAAAVRRESVRGRQLRAGRDTHRQHHDGARLRDVHHLAGVPGNQLKRDLSMTTQTAEQLRKEWQTNPRWKGVERPYKAEDVVRLRGTVHIEHSLARLGAEKLWRYIHEKPFVNALGALTGNQAMQQVKAGLDAIYLSGWQVAGDANLSGEMYPDQSLYPANSVPSVVKRINNTLLRADQIHTLRATIRSTGSSRSWPTRKRASVAC